MNICSISLVIRKMQIKILMRYHYISIMLAEIIPTVREDAEQQKVLYMLVGVNIAINRTTLECILTLSGRGIHTAGLGSSIPRTIP